MKNKRLTAEQERVLAAQVKQGSSAARNQLATTVYDFVLREASKLSRPEAPFEDLVQEGMLGALHAANKFDPDKARFATYAFHWVRAYMWDYIGTNRTQIDATGLNGRLTPEQLEARAAIQVRPIEEHLDLAGPELDLIEKLDRERVMKLLDETNLTEQERWVIEHRILHAEDKQPSLQSLAEQWDYSREWARKCELSALKKLRKAAKVKAACGL